MSLLVEPQPAEPVALFDLDGTMADFDSEMENGLKSLMGPGEDPKYNESMYEDVPYMKARRRLIKSMPGFWRNLPILQAGFDIYREAVKLKFRPHVLTKGPTKVAAAYTEKVEWCKNHLPDVPVTISDDKGLVYGKILVDDWPPYIKRWAQWRPRGLVIAVAHRWNEGIDKDMPNVVRYDGTNLDYIVERMRAVRATAGD